MDKLSINFVLSQRGNKTLVINDFKFIKRHVAKDGMILWNCSVRTCKAMCHSRDDQICDYSLDHNHLPDVQKLSRQAINNSCKRKALDDISERPAKIIHAEIANSLYKNNLTPQDLDFIRHNINRNRAKMLPAVSKNIEKKLEIVTEDKIESFEDSFVVDIKEETDDFIIDETNVFGESITTNAETETSNDIADQIFKESTNNMSREIKDVDVTQGRMDEENQLLKTTINDEKPKNRLCSLYGQLIAEKLESLNKIERIIVMNDIDNLLFRATIKHMGLQL